MTKTILTAGGLLGLTACGGAGADLNHEVGLKLSYQVQSESRATDYKWTEGGGVTAQSGTLLLGNQLLSSGTREVHSTTTTERTWHIIGKTYDDLDIGARQEDLGRLPVYWAEGVDVVTGTSGVEATEVTQGASGPITTTSSSTEEHGPDTHAYQFVLWGAYGTGVLGGHNFVFTEVLAGSAPADLGGLLTKHSPRVGDIWHQGGGIRRVVGTESLVVGGNNVDAVKVEIRQVRSPDLTAGDLLGRCLNEDESTLNVTTTGGGSTQLNRKELVLNPGCEAGVVSERVGHEWWHDDVLVQFEGTDYVVQIGDFGYEWVECTPDRIPLGRGTAKVLPDSSVTLCGAPTRFVQYTFTEETAKRVSLRSREVQPLE